MNVLELLELEQANYARAYEANAAAREIVRDALLTLFGDNLDESYVFAHVNIDRPNHVDVDYELFQPAGSHSFTIPASATLTADDMVDWLKSNIPGVVDANELHRARRLADLQRNISSYKEMLAAHEADLAQLLAGGE